jgi:hypothetical protein
MELKKRQGEFLGSEYLGRFEIIMEFDKEGE